MCLLKAGLIIAPAYFIYKAVKDKKERRRKAQINQQYNNNNPRLDNRNVWSRKDSPDQNEKGQYPPEYYQGQGQPAYEKGQFSQPPENAIQRSSSWGKDKIVHDDITYIPSSSQVLNSPKGYRDEQEQWQRQQDELDYYKQRYLQSIADQKEGRNWKGTNDMRQL